MTGLDLSRYDRTAKDIITTLDEYGWTFKQARAGAMASAPDGNVSTLVPLRTERGRARANSERVMRAWIRDHPKPVTLNTVVTDVFADGGKLQTPAEARENINNQVLEVALGRSVAVVEKIERGIVGKKEEVRVLESRVRTELAAARNAEPRIVSRKPWLAHRRPASKNTVGTRYESQAVVERKWSDGTIDYVCAFCGDTFTSTNPKSVSAHYRSHRAPVDPPNQAPLLADPEYMEPLSARKPYVPSERLVLALAEFLRNSDGDSVEEWATAALEWMRLRPDLPAAVEHQEVAPLTAEQQVERIAAIIGQPHAGQVAALEAEVLEWRQRAESAESDLDALHDLTRRATGNRAKEVV